MIINFRDINEDIQNIRIFAPNIGEFFSLKNTFYFLGLFIFISFLNFRAKK